MAKKVVCVTVGQIVAVVVLVVFLVASFYVEFYYRPEVAVFRKSPDVYWSKKYADDGGVILFIEWVDTNDYPQEAVRLDVATLTFYLPYSPMVLNCSGESIVLENSTVGFGCFDIPVSTFVKSNPYKIQFVDVSGCCDTEPNGFLNWRDYFYFPPCYNNTGIEVRLDGSWQEDFVVSYRLLPPSNAPIEL